MAEGTMSTMAENDIVSHEELVRRASALIPMLRERSAAAERDRRVSDEVIDAVRAADLFRILQPRAYGGFEHDYRTALDVCIEIGAGCGPTAWVVGLGIIHQWLMGCFPPEAQEDMWRTNAGALMFGSYPPVAEVETVPGGWKVSGRWRYASGIHNGEWALLGAPLPPLKGDGPPVPSFIVVPKSDYRIEDTWHVIGLSATGSADVLCDGVFVPAHRSLPFAAVRNGDSPGAEHYDRLLYRLPMLSNVPIALMAPAIGMLRHATEYFVETTRKRETRGAVVSTGKLMADFENVQIRLGLARANYLAAREMAYLMVDGSRESTERHGRADLESRMQARLCQGHAVRLALQGVNALFDASGGPALAADNPMQRLWRDTNAVAKHISLNWDAVASMLGQHMLGLDPVGQW